MYGTFWGFFCFFLPHFAPCSRIIAQLASSPNSSLGIFTASQEKGCKSLSPYPLLPQVLHSLKKRKKKQLKKKKKKEVFPFCFVFFQCEQREKHKSKTGSLLQVGVSGIGSGGLPISSFTLLLSENCSSFQRPQFPVRTRRRRNATSAAPLQKNSGWLVGRFVLARQELKGKVVDVSAKRRVSFTGGTRVGSALPLPPGRPAGLLQPNRRQNNLSGVQRGDG